MTIHKQLEKLVEVSALASLNFDADYPFSPLVNPEWKNSKKRMLFIVESVDSADLREVKGKPKRLLRSLVKEERNGRRSELNAMRDTLYHTLRLGWKEYKSWYPDASPDWSIGVVNFNATRTMSLRDNARRNAELKCVSRIREVVKKLRPTDIVFFGDTISKYFFSSDPQIHVKRGWVIPTEFDGVRVNVTPSLDIEALYSGRSSSDDADDDDDDAADSTAAGDLIYFVSRNVANALARRHLYSIREGIYTPSETLSQTTKLSTP